MGGGVHWLAIVKKRDVLSLVLYLRSSLGVAIVMSLLVKWDALIISTDCPGVPNSAQFTLYSNDLQVPTDTCRSCSGF